jgi:hypothetical protein
MTTAIKDIDLTRLMVTVLKQCTNPPKLTERVVGTFYASMLGREITLLVVDPMVNRIPAAIMWCDKWRVSMDIPKDWPAHYRLDTRAAIPATVLMNKRIEGEEALIHDLTLLRVFF